MKDLDFLPYFLGIEITYSSCGFLLSQQKYITELFDHVTLNDSATSISSSVFIPMELYLKLRHDNGTLLPQIYEYRELVSSLMYLFATRPDISQVVHVLS